MAVKNVYIDGEEIPVKITGQGYNIIWAAYEAMWNIVFDENIHLEREKFVYVSEINMFIKYGHLPQSFDWTDYKVK